MTVFLKHQGPGRAIAFLATSESALKKHINEFTTHDLVRMRAGPGGQQVFLKYKDARIKLQSEALAGVKIVKLYGWEPPLGRELDRLRELELAALWKYKLAGIVSRCVFSVVPTVVAVATFALYLSLIHI